MNTVADLERNVPRQLLELPVWLFWKSQPNGDGKPKKLPYYVAGKPRSGKLDTPTDRSKLVTFNDAKRRYDPDGYAGFGVALGLEPDTKVHLSGIDLDGSVRDGEVAPRALEVIAAGHGAYAETSPSGTGLKIFGTGDIGKEAKPGLEIYSGLRFFAVTGEHIGGNRLSPLDDAAALARRHWAATEAAGAPVAQGGRNNAMFSLACGLRARNLPEADAWQALLDANRACIPPLDERELRQVLRSAWRYPAGFALTDLGNAQRLVARHGLDLRYVPEFKSFLIYRDGCWTKDLESLQVQSWTKDCALALFDEARGATDEDRRKRLAQWALASQNVNRLRAARDLAHSEPGVPLAPSELDKDDMLLGVANGVVNLRDGTLREARREDYITKRAPVAYDRKASAPLWRAFVERITGGDASLAAYLQRVAGYCLTGQTVEQCLFVLFGLGANGKSTYLNTLRAALGEYAAVTDVQTWMTRDRQGPSNDLAALRGARTVISSETEEGQRFAEVLVKLATGGDSLKARFLYGEFFEFRPVFKLLIAANHKPVIRGDDHAIWRRIRLLPFTVTIPPEEQDRTLETKLRGELPGVLAWAVDGCLEWQRNGLGMPEVVQHATDEYREEMDSFGAFLTECCVLAAKCTVRAGEFYAEYRLWSERQGLDFPLSQLRLWRKLSERGITKVNTMHGVSYRGVGLRSANRGDQLEDAASWGAARGGRP